MPFKAVLWDLDGTTADTANLHFHAWHTTLAEEEHAYSRDDFERDFGRTNAALLADLFPDRSAAEHQSIADRKERAFRSAMPGGVQLLPGVRAWLEAIQETGLPQVVCSSGPTANIAATVIALEIADFFLGLVSGVHVPQGKPAPDLFLRGAALAGVHPRNCLVIEDSKHGVEAAVRAEMHCVVVGQRTGNVDRVEWTGKHAQRQFLIPSLDGQHWRSIVEGWNS